MRSIWPAAWLGLFLILGAGGSLNSQATSSSWVITPDSTAPSGADAMLRAADLQADAALLRRAYETLHPGLLRYNSPAQIDAALFS